MKKQIKIWVIILLSCCTGFSQDSIPDTTLWLQKVEITERVDEFSAGQNVIRIDSLTLQNYNDLNIADLLSEQSPVFIKSYGPAGASTISIRGTDSKHTTVFWNGLNINSPTLGVADLSLPPVFVADEILIQRGGGSSLYGSGIIGGSIHLNNRPVFDSILKIQGRYSLGSFSAASRSMKLERGNRKWHFASALSHYRAKNDFPFVNIAELDAPIVKMENAGLDRLAFVQELSRKINEHSYLGVRLWFQDNERELPGSMTSGISQAKLNDRTYRGMAEWKYFGRKYTWHLKSAWFNESSLYFDPMIDLNSPIHYNTFINEATVKKRFTDHFQFLAGVNGTRYDVNSSGFDGEKDQTSIGTFGSLNVVDPSKSLNVVLNLRQEWIAGVKVPFTPSIGAEWKFARYFRLKGHLSRNFKIPTLNERFWNPGGNPNLLPESGWSEELGIIIGNSQQRPPTVNLNVTGFNSVIENRIQWQPTSSGIWAPRNLKKVQSRGVESFANLAGQLMAVKYRLSIGYTYVNSIELESNDGLENPGKQLMYVPVHDGNTALHISYGKYSLGYSQVYVGERFVNPDNSQFLKPYTLGNLSVTWKEKVGNEFVQLSFQIRNIGNADYQVIQWFAMPGRNYWLSVSVGMNREGRSN